MNCSVCGEENWHLGQKTRHCISCKAKGIDALDVMPGVLGTTILSLGDKMKENHALKKELTELRDFKSEAMDLIRFYSFGTNPFDDRSKVEVRDGISTEWSKDRMRHGKRAREFIEKWGEK